MLETIKSSSDISLLFSHGKRINTPFITFIVLKNEKHGLQGRVAFIAGKKLGNAVWRNRAKRRMRALFQDLGKTWTGYDVIFLAKYRITSSSYHEVLVSCNDVLTKEGFK